MKRKDILTILRNNPLSIEDHDESFKILSDYLDVNELCFRNARDIRIVKDVLWVDNVSIDLKDVKIFNITPVTSYKHGKKYQLKEIKE